MQRNQPKHRLSNSQPNGDNPDADSLTGVYDELRGLAAHYLSGERRSHTLQPTALVHESFLRLLKGRNLDGLAGSHLLALSARAMRSVLVDHARRRGRMKRGGHAQRVRLDDVVDLYEERAIDLIALDEALTKLAEVDAQQATVIELRFFGGLSEEETAAMLGVSARTVGRVWRRARAWLRHALGESIDDGE